MGFSGPSLTLVRSATATQRVEVLPAPHADTGDSRRPRAPGDREVPGRAVSGCLRVTVKTRRTVSRSQRPRLYFAVTSWWACTPPSGLWPARFRLAWGLRRKPLGGRVPVPHTSDTCGCSAPYAAGPPLWRPAPGHLHRHHVRPRPRTRRAAWCYSVCNACWGDSDATAPRPAPPPSLPASRSPAILGTSVVITKWLPETTWDPKECVHGSERRALDTCRRRRRHRIRGIRRSSRTVGSGVLGVTSPVTWDVFPQ